MARLALAVGYTSRTASRSEQPVQLYLGSSFQAAKEAAQNPPEGIGYAEAYRLDSAANKRFHRPAAEPVAAAVEKETAGEEVLSAEEAPAAEESPASADEDPGLDLGTTGRKARGKA